MRKLNTIFGLSIALFSTTGAINANNVNTNKQQSSIENTNKVSDSELMITLTENNHDKKDGGSPSQTIRLYYIKSSHYSLDSSPIGNYYGFIKDGHPVVIPNMYVTHNLRKCIVVFYRNKIYFEPIHKSNGKTLKLEGCIVQNLNYDFKDFPEKQTIEKINQSKKQYEQYLTQKE